MTRHDDLTRLRHVFDHVREAVEMAAGRQRADLDRDRMLELALVRLSRLLVKQRPASARKGNDVILPFLGPKSEGSETDWFTPTIWWISTSGGHRHRRPAASDLRVRSHHQQCMALLSMGGWAVSRPTQEGPERSYPDQFRNRFDRELGERSLTGAIINR